MVPIVVLIFVTPPALRPEAAASKVTAVSTEVLRRPFPALPDGRAPEVAIPEVMIRAAQDTAGTLDDRLITVIGFHAPGGRRRGPGQGGDHLLCRRRATCPHPPARADDPDLRNYPDQTWLESKAPSSPTRPTGIRRRYPPCWSSPPTGSSPSQPVRGAAVRRDPAMCAIRIALAVRREHGRAGRESQSCGAEVPRAFHPASRQPSGSWMRRRKPLSPLATGHFASLTRDQHPARQARSLHPMPVNRRIVLSSSHRGVCRPIRRVTTLAAPGTTIPLPLSTPRTPASATSARSSHIGR